MEPDKIQSIQMLTYTPNTKYQPLNREGSDSNSAESTHISNCLFEDYDTGGNSWLNFDKNSTLKKMSYSNKDFSPIISKNFAEAYMKSKNSCSLWFLKIFYYIRYKLFTHTVSKEQRKIYLNGLTVPYFFPPNKISTLKHNIFTFIPNVLIDQFKHFQNLFYLIVVFAQFIPKVRVGPLFTFIAPLVFVLSICIIREIVSHFQRMQKDKELNSAEYMVFDRKYSNFVKTKASDICIGDLVQLNTNQRVPCDMILLHATQGGITFVRTDQLDGETDWKLRRAISHTQNVGVSQIELMNAWVVVEPPRKDIYKFVGTFYWNSKRNYQYQFEPQLGLSISSRNLQEKNPNVAIDIYDENTDSTNVSAEPLNLENTLWASTVVTTGPVIGLAIYSGVETRTLLNTSAQRSKTGLFNTELNFISKALFVILGVVSAILGYFSQNKQDYFINVIRFVLILSSIIPISLRVNMDMARLYYAYSVTNDKKMGQVLVRNTAIAEELGRIDILLTDKTGTLTRNDMVLKEIHFGSTCYGQDRFEGLKQSVQSIFSNKQSSVVNQTQSKITEQIRRMMLGLSLCHTVLPTREEGFDEVTFQASSPDEIAMTTFARTVGLNLIKADEDLIRLELFNGEYLDFEVCYRFPFSSETKRMGCIVRHIPSPDKPAPYLQSEANKYLLFVKGAEQAVCNYLIPNSFPWLDEECDNLGRAGLRTMVFAVKEIAKNDFINFQQIYHSAQTTLTRRSEKMKSITDELFTNLELIGVTGVEDRLQDDVPITIESFRHGGISVWMLTGDKLETATCIALSAGLKSRQQIFVTLTYKKYPNVSAAKIALDNVCTYSDEVVIVVDGDFVDMAFRNFKEDFINTISNCSAAVFARCTPTLKADIVGAVKTSSRKRVAAIGDGGNDVSMLQKADCGVGIFGKEGNQAAFASDYAITEFKQIHRLFFWHGRLNYMRSSKLAQFVIHRGLSIAVMQVLLAYFDGLKPIASFKGWLTVGYATYYTMFPVFSLVLTQDLSEKVIFMFPELYSYLRRNKALTLKKLLWWFLISVYQGFVIVFGAIKLFEFTPQDAVSVTFSSLILAELLNIILEVNQWHFLMVLAEICSIAIYFLSIFLLPDYFELETILTVKFWGKVITLTSLAWLPIFFLMNCIHFMYPTRDSKLTFL